MVKLLTQLISGLSETVGAWDEFEQYEIGHFLFDGEFATVSSPLISSIAAVRKVFSDLKVLLRKLEQLERELCKDNPQGVSHLFPTLLFCSGTVSAYSGNMEADSNSLMLI